MSRLVRTLRVGGLGAVVGLGSQQVARSNAAAAAARLMHQRREREDVDAYLCAQRPDRRPVGTGTRG